VSLLAPKLPIYGVTLYAATSQEINAAVNPPSDAVLNNTSDIILLAFMGVAAVALVIVLVLLVRYCKGKGGGGGSSGQVYAAPKPEVKKNGLVG
jgi:hypothetical protein